MSTARRDIGYDGPEDRQADPVKRKKIRGPSITDRIETLLRATSPRWWSPFEIEHCLQARSVARRLREIMEIDRVAADGSERPKHLRSYEEKWIDNAAIGRHKVYRWKGQQSQPSLF